MGAGLEEGGEVVASWMKLGGVSGGGPILCGLKVAGDCDDVEETYGGL